jgi:hypothetical protein
MSVDEANAIMQPTPPATTLVAMGSDTGGSCSYEASKIDIPLSIYFAEWKGPVPIPPEGYRCRIGAAHRFNWREREHLHDGRRHWQAGSIS